MDRNKLKAGPKHFMQTNKNMYCWNCKKQTSWIYILGEVHYNGVVPGLECKECGETVPAFALSSYQVCGIPTIPV